MLSREEKRGDVTAELSWKVAAKLRREFTLDGVSRPIDYIGSCVKRIEVVIDE